LSQISYDKGQYRKAQQLSCQAVEIVEKHRGQIPSSDGRSTLLAQHIDKYLGLMQACLALNESAQAFATLERCRARSLMEMLAERPMDFLSGAPAELLQQ